jgi:hypothetical protein
MHFGRSAEHLGTASCAYSRHKTWRPSRNQDLYWYGCLGQPTMRQEWVQRLLVAYETILREDRYHAEILLFDARADAPE